MTGQTASRRLAAIMFADIVGYTALMQEDESRAKALRDKHRDIVEDRVRAHAGEVVQYYGDGALCLFSSAKEAVIGACEIQRALLAEPAVPHRIGIHIGDVVQDASGVFGDCVNVASRIESLAIPGSVLVSDKVQAELENHPGLRTKSLGTFRLKNVRRPMEVFALDDDSITVPEAQHVTSEKASQEAKSIAVMPFTSLGSSEESAYFADGVSEEIINGLSKVDGLSVISRTTCMAMQASGVNSIEVGRRLGVAHQLEGRVRKAGDKVRVSVELVNTADGYQVWTESYDGSLEDVFELQDNIALQVVRALRVNLLEKTENIVEQETTDTEAHSLYLKGLHHWNRRNPENVKKATECFNQALEIDAGYSSAQCALSHCYAFMGSCGAMAPTKAYARALEYAMRAIENNPKNAEAHLAIANIKFYHYWDWEGTRTSLEKAESLGLSSGLLHQSFGLYYAAMGQHQEGVRKMEQALQLDPLSVPVLSMLGTLYLFDEQYDRAMEVFDEILELEPTFRSAHQYKGVTMACQGLYAEALQEFMRYHKMVNHPKKGLIGVVIANHALGNKESAEEYLGRLYQRLEEESSASVLVDLAVIHSGIGDFDKAFDFLNRVYEQRFSIACMGMIWVIRCPLFKDGLHQQPEFRQFLKRMGLPA
jgi:adenylate cyclase